MTQQSKIAIFNAHMHNRGLVLLTEDGDDAPAEEVADLVDLLAELGEGPVVTWGDDEVTKEIDPNLQGHLVAATAAVDPGN